LARPRSDLGYAAAVAALTNYSVGWYSALERGVQTEPRRAW
jgi:hypothetical protein